MRELALSPKQIALFTKNNRALLRQVEKRGGVSVELKDGYAEIEGEGGADWIAEQVLKALAAGFPQLAAYKLFEDDYYLEALSLQDAFRRNEKLVERYKARVIGAEGKAKRTIEHFSGAWLSIPGDEVLFLGRFDDIKLAREAVLRLLEGQNHSSVFHYLEREDKKRKYAFA